MKTKWNIFDNISYKYPLHVFLIVFLTRSILCYTFYCAIRSIIRLSRHKNYFVSIELQTAITLYIPNSLHVGYKNDLFFLLFHWELRKENVCFMFYFFFYLYGFNFERWLSSLDLKTLQIFFFFIIKWNSLVDYLTLMTSMLEIFTVFSFW